MESEKIPLMVASDEEGDVRIEETADRRECSPSALYTNGRIRCHLALALAQKLNVGSKDMGKLLNHLGVKIKDCSLGCFE